MGLAIKIGLAVLLLASLTAAGGGCAPAISPALTQQAGPPVTFAELTAHPEQYQGQMKVLGGLVVSVVPSGSGSLMMVDQRDLDRALYPVGTASGGNFLVESDQFLSPDKFQPKSKIVVAGVVQGQRQGLLALRAKQIHFWEYPEWEKWKYPIPREWYNYDPAMEYWYTQPYYNPWRGGGRR